MTWYDPKFDLKLSEHVCHSDLLARLDEVQEELYCTTPVLAAAARRQR